MCMNYLIEVISIFAMIIGLGAATGWAETKLIDRDFSAHPNGKLSWLDRLILPYYTFMESTVMNLEYEMNKIRDDK